jgi:hypothetical protein
MVRLFTFAVVLAACSYTPQGSAPIGGDDDGPPADAAIDVVDDLDDDDDGVLDTADNCPAVANTDQHNEDDDDKGDACDPCPMLASMDADGDGDGIGEACDPHPGVAGDKLVQFDGFGAAGIPAGWSQVGGVAGDWVVMADSLDIDTNQVPHFLRFDTLIPHATIEIGFGVDLPDTSNSPAVTAIVDSDETLENFTNCAVLLNGDTVRLQTFDGSFHDVAQDTTTIAVPSEHRVIATIDAANAKCTFFEATTIIQGRALTNNNRQHVGLRVRAVRTTLHYIAVYRSP